MFKCIHAAWNLCRNQQLKIKSRLHCIDIYDDNCMMYILLKIIPPPRTFFYQNAEIVSWTLLVNKKSEFAKFPFYLFCKKNRKKSKISWTVFNLFFTRSYLSRYESCLQCSLDPMCGWDRERGVCSGYTSTLLSDPTRSKDGLCDSSIFKRSF